MESRMGHLKIFFVSHMIQDPMGMLYPPRVPLNLSVPWDCPYTLPKKSPAVLEYYVG